MKSGHRLSDCPDKKAEHAAAHQRAVEINQVLTPGTATQDKETTEHKTSTCRDMQALLASLTTKEELERNEVNIRDWGESD